MSQVSLNSEVGINEAGINDETRNECETHDTPIRLYPHLPNRNQGGPICLGDVQLCCQFCDNLSHCHNHGKR